MTKPTKWHVRPAKTRIRPVWSESSLSAWRKLGSLATNWAHSEDGCPGWSESSRGTQSFCWFCHEAAHMYVLIYLWLSSTDVIKRYFCWRHVRAASRCVKPKSQYGLYLVSWDVLYFPRPNKRHIYATPLRSSYLVWLHYKRTYIRWVKFLNKIYWVSWDVLYFPRPNKLHIYATSLRSSYLVHIAL